MTGLSHTCIQTNTHQDRCTHKASQSFPPPSSVRQAGIHVRDWAESLKTYFKRHLKWTPSVRVTRTQGLGMRREEERPVRPDSPSGFCLGSCSRRIKDTPCLWSGEESFTGEGGKMEEGIWISVRLERLNSITHLWEESVNSDYFCSLWRRKKKSSNARMCPNQTCNYNLEHAVQCNSSRHFKMKTVHTVSCTLCSSITKQIIFHLCFLLVVVVFCFF